jgi:protein disulfide-isomerase A1
LAQVDCVEEEDLCDRYQIPIFPTILTFEGKNHTSYDGPREVEAITAFMKRRNQPLITKLDSTGEITQFSTKDSVTIVGIFEDDDELSRQTFFTIAENHRDTYLFGSTSSAEFCQDEEIAKPSIVLYRSSDNAKSVFTKEFDFKNIEAFLEDNSTPPISELGVSIKLSAVNVCFSVLLLYLFPSLIHSQSKRRPVGIIFAEGQDQLARLAAELKPIAQATLGKMIWIAANATEYEWYATKLALRPGKWPAFAIEHAANEFKYAFPTQGVEGDINEQAIRKVVDDMLAGNLQSTVLSEPEPTEDSGEQGLVTKLVASTYNKLVMENDKDVLVLFYSPTCEHCSAMAPNYEDVGALLQPYAKHVVIAKIDGTRNDVWPKVHSYPTLKLFRSGSKDRPVTYEGNRTTGDLVEFLRKSASPATARLLDSVVAPDTTASIHDEL